MAWALMRAIDLKASLLEKRHLETSTEWPFERLEATVCELPAA